jgi:hypothetical protein
MSRLWREVAADFEPDGALRDIYVHGTTMADWQAVLGHLRERYAPLEFTIDGEPAVLPARAAEIFPTWGHAAPSLYVDVGGIDVRCHFFAVDEVEFDFRPGDVRGPERLAAVVSFMRGLVTAVGKTAVLTMESVPEAVILRIDPPDGQVVFAESSRR